MQSVVPYCSEMIQSIQGCSCTLKIIYLAHVVVALAAPFSLRDNRQSMSNTFSLYCLNSSDLNDSRALFFLNDSVLNSANYPSFQLDNTNSQPGVVTFHINRQLEGNYSCGINVEQRSTSVPFIGKLICM